MNAILSIKPQYVSAIASGSKHFEYRKKVFARPVERVLIYSSSPVKLVVGEFRIRHVIEASPQELWEKTYRYSGIKKELYDRYFQGRDVAYALEIVDLKIYDNPKELPFRAPQSYRYVENIDEL